MFLLCYGIWGEGDERYGACVGRMAGNLWLQEYWTEVARSVLGLPPGEYPAWCPDVPGRIFGRR